MDAFWNRRKHKISSGNYEQRLKSCEMWLWGKDLNIFWSWSSSDGIDHTLRRGYLLLLRLIGKRPPGRSRAGMLDRVKEGGPYTAVKRCTLDQELYK